LLQPTEKYVGSGGLIWTTDLWVSQQGLWAQRVHLATPPL